MEPTQKSDQEKSSLVKTELDSGFNMIEFHGYTSYEDFMLIYDKIKQIIEPDEMSYSVDSLCIMGSIRKDGILMRMSNEGISEYVSIFYNKNAVVDADRDKIENWAEQINRALCKI